ncbi:YhcH/YjgK/YiaL family protein [Jeotgalibaca sp. A122]|uniref:YhcH/YjgK/YiaL family protein n=1 Tax=Jeotgalibaca sp. A122 TaxID=3457322 RepID=UPI003FD0D538
MLYSTLQDYNEKDYIKVQQVLAFLKTLDLKELELGRFEIGEGIFANVMEYETSNINERQFESHRNYLDIQYVISGTEEIHVSPYTNYEEAVPYDLANDLELLEEPHAYAKFILNENEFVVMGANEPHRGAGMVDGMPVKVRKLVVKIPQ